MTKGRGGRRGNCGGIERRLDGIKRSENFFFQRLALFPFLTTPRFFHLFFSPLRSSPRPPLFYNGLFRCHPRSLERDRRQARGASARRRRQGRAQAGEVIRIVFCFFASDFFFWLALSINSTSGSREPLRLAFELVLLNELASNLAHGSERL